MQDFPETPNQSGHLGHQNGAIDASTFPLGPTVPNGPTSSGNLLQYDHDPNDNGSTGFSYG